jgi:hypothetical protein
MSDYNNEEWPRDMRLDFFEPVGDIVPVVCIECRILNDSELCKNCVKDCTIERAK